MSQIYIGCGQITWFTRTVDGERQRPPEDQVLAEIAQAGYEGAPAGMRNNRSPQETIEVYAKHGLKPAPGYMGAEFWKAELAESILEQAKRLGVFMRDVGCSEVYVAASGMDHVTPTGKTRRDVAGHVSPEDALSDAEYKQFAQVLNQVGEITLEAGVKSCFHNHVGTVIETREEVDRLFSLVDPELVFMGPDTGHLAWGGVDVVQFFRDYASQIKTVHLKDIDPKVLKSCQEQEWNYGTSSDNGIFAELGEGFIDFPTVFDILKGVDFSGWLITETDVTQKETPLESVTISRDYLKSLGL